MGCTTIFHLPVAGDEGYEDDIVDINFDESFEKDYGASKGDNNDDAGDHDEDDDDDDDNDKDDDDDHDDEDEEMRMKIITTTWW